MKKLEFPVLPIARIPPRPVTMNEYLTFVQLAYDALANKDRVREMRLKEGPTARFTLIRDDTAPRQTAS